MDSKQQILATGDTVQKTAEMIAHRAVEDLALEAENSVAEMLRLVDRMHRAEPAREPSAGAAPAPSAVDSRKLNWETCLDTFVILHPKCKKEYIEQFRQLRSRLTLVKKDWANAGTELKILSIASPSEKEGKSFVAANVAAALALGSDRKVLLIDLNPTSAYATTLLGIQSAPGLTEAIETNDWTPSVRSMADTNLSVMPIGRLKAGNIDPVDFRRLPILLEKLRESFDWIILDGPAFRESSDAELTASYADANLLVVRKNHTAFEDVAQALNAIPAERVLGIVFNHH